MLQQEKPQDYVISTGQQYSVREFVKRCAKLLDLDLTTPIAWVFGNEAWGLPTADLATADIVAKVPMWGAAESLNLSTAAAVCLYATAAAQHTSTTAIEMPTTGRTS